MVPEKVEANERIRATQIELGLGDDQPLPFLCECSDVRCSAVIRITAADYTAARADGARCVVIEGHPYEGRPVVVGQGYVVVEK